MRSILLALLITAASTKIAHSDGLIYKLPKDGTSVAFEGTGVLNGVDKKKEILTIASVGEAIVDGEKCRWIEYMTDYGEAVDRNDFLIFKLLIPERHLGTGKAPWDHVIRGWGKYGRKGIAELEDAETVKEAARAFTHRLRPFLSGPPDDMKELPQMQIDGKLGKLTCDGVSGGYEFKDGAATELWQFENRLHEKAPFGVIMSVWKFKADVAGLVISKGTTTYTLTETSNNAKSELPDRN